MAKKPIDFAFQLMTPIAPRAIIEISKNSSLLSDWWNRFKSLRRIVVFFLRSILVFSKLMVEILSKPLWSLWTVLLKKQKKTKNKNDVCFAGFSGTQIFSKFCLIKDQGAARSRTTANFSERNDFATFLKNPQFVWQNPMKQLGWLKWIPASHGNNHHLYWSLIKFNPSTDKRSKTTIIQVLGLV